MYIVRFDSLEFRSGAKLSWATASAATFFLELVMGNYEIRNGLLITPREERFTSLWVSDGQIASIGKEPPDRSQEYEIVDASGMYVTPGLFDLQVNGTQQCDLWSNPTAEELGKMRRELAERGVTSFLPTLITDDIGRLCKNRDFLSSAGAGKLESWSQDHSSARMPGVHLEGPFLSPARPGVHPPEFIKSPNVSDLELLVTDEVLLITMACEEDSGGECIDWLKGRTNISLGHSNATIEEAETAFGRGVRLMTHTFNALPALHHRAPGAVGAAFLDDQVICCVIADGLHLAPKIVELILKIKGEDRVILVTDVAHIGTTGGDLVGSSIILDEAVRNLVKWSVSDFRTAIAMATANPSEALGLGERIGSLKPGCLADLVFWDKSSLQIEKVMIGGRAL